MGWWTGVEYLSVNIPERKWSMSPSCLYGSIVGQGNEEDEWWVQGLLLLPQWFESFSSELPRVKWLNLVCLGYL